eukprot:CAMPEP_0184870378 /NCGR_PEP_ID=MMETSP0580-20130426/37247_1 /TAXON_ID=1118495 /ORGANISM="Dactyliosolen fragilissimus" /LENGTH=1026 /DNA_ID=CAMNT_0027372417 /DNA_START=29 /DNA_END=3110 /DNA_ORIENTATION=+
MNSRKISLSDKPLKGSMGEIGHRDMEKMAHLQSESSSQTPSSESRSELNNSNNASNHVDEHHHSLGSSSSSLSYRLSAKSHAFSGAMLTPKHARDLNPYLVLGITHALAEQAIAIHSSSPDMMISKSNRNDRLTDNIKSSIQRKTGDDYLSHHKRDSVQVQYTVWITEAWSVLGWAEPSAALFWEMATMYHTLYLAERERGHHNGSASKSTDANQIFRDKKKKVMDKKTTNNSPFDSGNLNDNSATFYDSSPSMDSQDNNNHNMNIKLLHVQTQLPESPVSADESITKLSSKSMRTNNIHRHSHGSRSNSSNQHSNSKSTASSAKELPLWLVGMFLLLHCEDMVFWRNISGQDERRFDVANNNNSEGTSTSSPHIPNTMHNDNKNKNIWNDNLGVGFGMLHLHPSLSPRTRIHAGQHADNTNCTTYILRHLRKFLLLSAIPHNPNALWAVMTLNETKSPHEAEYIDRQNKTNSQTGASIFAIPQQQRPDAQVLHQRHEEEHLHIGINVRLTSADLERLNFILQSPSGGRIHDTPLSIANIVMDHHTQFHHTPAENDISIQDAEQQIRKHLEHELLHLETRNNNAEEEQNIDTVNINDASKNLGKLSLADETTPNSHGDRAISKSNISISDGKIVVTSESDLEDIQKEMKYTNLRGKTILLKPNFQPDKIHSAGASVHSINSASDLAEIFAQNTRLHDLQISNCSDAHIYLLQPFEHVTISACTGCTIVIGAVAGLLHIVDCERTTITSAARRIMVSNCFEVLNCAFTPSHPILVGDNRSCQFAPYNTYYDGLREHLLLTGLAAAIVTPENITYSEMGMQGPPLKIVSNKWKQPVELAKLEIPQIHSQKNQLGADDKALSTGGDMPLQTPILLPPSEFHVLFVPLDSEADRLKRTIQDDLNSEDDIMLNNVESYDSNSTVSSSSSNYANNSNGGSMNKQGSGLDNQYCRHLAEVLQLSPFRLPAEYERRALIKADRMRSLQQAIQTDLNLEQKMSLEKELNRGFRDWLVTSGNLRQVLDLVHLERNA